MRCLLDTHILLWAVSAPDRIAVDSLAMLRDPATSLVFSAASIWEVAIKNALDRADFRVDPRKLRDGLLRNGYTELAIRSEHAIAAGALPAIHNDPFDRMLVAQAQMEGITLLTNDNQVANYPGPIQSV